jgi:hypothetical protein
MLMLVECVCGNCSCEHHCNEPCAQCLDCIECGCPHCNRLSN